MEDVLAVYQRPYDANFPVVCLDEAAKQILGEVREPLPMQSGQMERVDNQYERRGTAALFMAFLWPLNRLRECGRCGLGSVAPALILLRWCGIWWRNGTSRRIKWCWFWTI